MSVTESLLLIGLACLANIGIGLMWCAMRVSARAEREAEAWYAKEASERDIEAILTNAESAGAK